MSSQAFEGLKERLKDVDQLMAAHAAIAGSKPGRKYEVLGINRAALLMLSAHFEGYLEDVMAEALETINPDLDPAVLIRGFHNPWPDRIDELFAFLGLEKPAREISWQKAGNKTVRENLEILVGTRNRVAHGATGVTVYKTDVVRLRKYVLGFAERFDQKVRARVVTLVGLDPWPD